MRPRILHVYKDYFPPVVGGVERTVNLMASGCLDEFDESVLVCSGSRRRIRERIDGVTVFREPELFRYSSAPFSPAFPFALRRLAAKADLLHFHHPNPTGDIAYLMSGCGKPAVMTYHSDIVRQKYSRAVFSPIQERMMRACRVIMPTSPNYIDSSEWLSRFRSKCHVVPLGVNLLPYQRTPATKRAGAELRAKTRLPIVVFLGKLRYYKGLQYLVRAMAKVQGTLWLIGSGPEEAGLRRVAAEAGIADRVVFWGELPLWDVVVRLHAADLFCMPSHLRSEAFGLSQVEAMASGLPVVSTNIQTGVPFVNKHGETGLSVDPADSDELAKSINALLSNDDLRLRMGEAAVARAHSMFSAGAMCENVKRVYREVLGS